MARVLPFRALRPRDELAERVIAPPYDVLTDAEARAEAEDAHSFVHVTRPEVDCAAGVDPHSPAAWGKARENLDAMIAEEVLMRDDAPTYYFYGQKMGAHEQVGILAGASVDEYDRGLIKKHEFTRPDKEDDRTRHMEVLEAQVGLVFLTFRPNADLQVITEQIVETAPAWKVTTPDGVVHALWPAPLELVEPITRAFEQVDTLYVADGHHRSAAASRYHAKVGDALSSTFLAGLFPADHLYVMAYNRVVHDLNGLSDEAFLAAVDEHFERRPSPTAEPDERGKITMFFQDRWWSLRAREGVVDEGDPVGRLDVAVLQRLVLGPVLGIDDPRRSQRISFVGGIRGAAALESEVRAGGAVAFHLFPTGLDQLFDVADAGEVMPPKSTWFEPKLREGVAVKLLR
ncbi:MAG: DUF1015 domain-containing protein [Deltaproteobacteria bacterium]|nr:DUF1015 domain-containing protein [Deltaproteobacteria bacterium]